METFCEFVVVVGVDFKGGEIDADGSGIPDGGCTAHLEVTDCRPDFVLRFEMEVFGCIWEFCLIDDDEGARLFVEGDGFHVEDVGAHCVPPIVSGISISPVHPQEWSAARVRGR